MQLSDIQIDDKGKLRHFLAIDGLTPEILTSILDRTDNFLADNHHSIKREPLLRGKTVFNLFFEASTRTRTSFELAAKRLSAEVMNLNIATSATKKGESLVDTIRNLQAMQCDMFIVRHHAAGAAETIARHVAPHISVLNGGDGRHSHPTQAMLDAYTIRHFKKDFNSLKVAIVGDILHSRVARSQMQALSMLGVNEVRVIAPKTLLPKEIDRFGVHAFYNLSQGLKDVDVIIMLRLQEERMQSGLIPSKSEYYKLYGLTEERLQIAKPNALVMHPGPINRGVEIASNIADGANSVILQQVNFGVAVRMAVMSMIIENSAEKSGDQK